MELLEQRILRDGKIRPGGILKVDGFLNHQIDPALLYDMAREFQRLFADEGVNKILTIEASGIAIACMTGYLFGCPLVFAKKSKSRNISDDVYAVEVESFTHGNTNTVVVSREYLGPEDRVLIVDDFLATGAALVGLKALVEQAGGTVVGAGIAIEKAFQGGGDL
ncbi:MAG: xanthine phosphoribosyltransferase, partial [Oscillospiraceae bacterium]|nr:xanthine phosphoribosyltransferase [Oscillospiraceae bacterium]